MWILPQSICPLLASPYSLPHCTSCPTWTPQSLSWSFQEYFQFLALHPFIQHAQENPSSWTLPPSVIFISLSWERFYRNIHIMPFWGISQVSQWFKKKKKSPANAGDTRDAGSIPGSGRFPGVGNGNPPQYSFLENSMDTGAWWAPIHRIAKSWTQLSTCTHTHTHTHTPHFETWLSIATEYHSKNPWTCYLLGTLVLLPSDL